MMQASVVRYRKVSFGIEGAVVARESSGIIRLRSQPELQDYPARLTDRLLFWAAEAPERTFIARRGPDGEWRRITYAQALDQARRIGQALLDRGLSAERPIVILSDNDLEHAMLALAAQFAGIPHSSVSPAYSLISQDHAKLKRIIALLTPGMVFAANGARYEKALAAAVPADVEVVVAADPPPARRATLFADLAGAGATAAADAAQAATGPDTVVKLLFTSGSTSMPKAVIITQRIICSNQQMLLQAYPFTGQEPPVLVDWLPWNHIFGGVHNIGFTLYNGGTLYIDDGKPTPAGIQETLRNLREIAPTIYFNVPKGYEEIAKALHAEPSLSRMFFSRVKMLFYAGAGLSPAVWQSLHAAAEATCGERIPIGTGLGMTETGPSAMFTNIEDVSPGMIGLPCAGFDIKLVPDGGKLEARYRSPSVTPGYWRSPDVSRQAFDDEGYFRSGDAVKFVDDRDPNRGMLFDGRIAEDFKLDTGTWVSVGPLRERIVALGNACVQDAVITGLNRDQVGALIFPLLDGCRRLAQLPATASAAQVLASAPVREFFVDLLSRLAQNATGSANRVVRAMLLVEPPMIDKGEITDKGSINQRAVLGARADRVAALYDDADPGVLRPRA
jgi:feruloyl-CoA synthase